ncbi:NADP-dependent oxidoreductase [candidate division KSB1 bacterium]
MKSLQVTAFGEPSVLSFIEVPVPEPNPGEALIRIKGAGVNPIDAKTRRGIGFAAELIKNDLPRVLGYEISGVIEKISPNVSDFKKGDHVYGLIGLPERSSCYAEYTTVLPEEIWHKPKTLSHIEAAGVPLAALTAWQALYETGNISKGDRVLIHAAAGGVGHFAVQFAKLSGAYVVGTASENNEQFLKEELGIDEVIDYNSKMFEECTGDIDLVLDCVGGEIGKRSLKVLKKDGLIIPLPTISAQEVINEAEKYNIRAKGMIVKVNREHLKKIAYLIETGKVVVNIDSVYPLRDGAKAHEKLEKGHVRGKIVLSTDDNK